MKEVYLTVAGRIRRELDAVCGFRHVVRDVHTHDVDPEQMRLLVARLPDTMDRVTRDIDSAKSLCITGSHARPRSGIQGPKRSFWIPNQVGDDF
jgi:hypothetical protein